MDLAASLAVTFEVRRDRVEGRLRAQAVKDTGVPEHPGCGVGTAAEIRFAACRREHHWFDGQAETRGELEVALIVGRHGHDGAGAVGHEHEIRDPDGQAFAGDRVQGVEAERQALLLHSLQHGLAGAAPAAFVEKRLELEVAGRRLDGQGMLRSHGQVGHAHERVGAGGEDAERRGALGDLEMRLDALGAANPMALHRADRLGPALERIEPGEQFLGVIGDPEEPLRDQAPLDRGARAPALAVDDLLVGEHRLIDRVPVDQRSFLVDEALPEQLQKKPLLPPVIVRPAGRELAAPIVAETQALELGAHVLDVGVGPLGGRDAVLDGGVLGRQPEGVPAHGLQDIPAPHALVARDHIPDGVVADMPHVELPARIGEHRETVKLLAPGILGGAEYARLLPAALDGGLDVLWAILWFHGHPRSLGEDNRPDYSREGPYGHEGGRSDLLCGR